MHVRPRVAVPERYPATDAAATGTRWTAKSSCWGRTIARSVRQENAPPRERCLLFFDAEAAVRAEKPRDGSKGPGGIVSPERNVEGSHWLRKSRAHPPGKYLNFRGAGLRHLAGSAAVLLACSRATRQPRRETMYRRAPREFARGATARS